MPKKRARILRKDSLDTNISVCSPENQENNGDEMPNILSIFRESVDSHAHDRLITQLKLDFYEKLSIQDFSEDFFNCCLYIIHCEDRTRSDPCLKFVVKFIIYALAKSENTDSKIKSLKLLKKFIFLLTEYHDVQESYARFHVVRAIKLLLNELTDDIEVPDVFFEKLQDTLLKRFWDIKSFIRAEAATASSRLQSPSNADCSIVISLIHLCKFDSSHTVRLSAIQALAITTKTLPVIIARCRDVNDLVRRMSYELLLKWKIMKPLTVSKRLQIMESGLTEKSDMVRNACIQLLKCWLEVSAGDPITLLKRLDVENNEEATELTLKTLIRSLSPDEIAQVVGGLVNKMDSTTKLVLEDQLDCETAFLWKVLVQFLSDKTTENHDLLDKISPNIGDFGKYLRRLFHKSLDQAENQGINLEESLDVYNIIKHLLVIVRYMDIFDEHNRQIMIDMTKWALSSENISFNYVEHLMKLFVHLEPNNEKVCNLTVELINELLFNDVDAKSEVVPLELSVVSIPPPQVAVPCEPIPVISSTPVPPPPPVDPSVVHREAIRKNKIEIVEIEVKINELNESLANCMRNYQFDKTEGVISNIKKLTEEKAVLLGKNEQLMAPAVSAKNIEPIIIGDTDEMVEGDPCLLNPGRMSVKEEKENMAWMVPGMETKVIKANMMTIAMIKECKMLWTLLPSLRTLFENVILISVQHADLNVRQKSMLSMGMCCLLDKELAIRYYKLFMQSLLIDHESVKEIALKSLVDIFIRFGIEPFQEAMIVSKREIPANSDDFKSSNQLDSTISSEAVTVMTEEDYNKCTTELMTPIIDLLNSPDTEILTTVAISLSKLLYNQKLMSSKLLSRLLLLWFNPVTEDNQKLRLYLSAFFSNFAAMSADNQEALTNCFLITMRTLFKAPAKSPLLEIDFNNVIGYFERITDSAFLIDNRSSDTADCDKIDNPCHDTLAVTVANQILNSPLSIEVKYYVPMLMRLRLSPSNVEVLRVLEPMVETMIKKVKEKKCVAALERFYKVIGKRIEDYESALAGPEERGDQPPVAATEPDSAAPPRDDGITQPVPTGPDSEMHRNPSLLEFDADGHKMDVTYLGDRNMHRANLVADTISKLSSINIDSTPAGSALSASVIDSINMPPPVMSGDEPVFKKPKNVRVTRSSSRLMAGGDSSLSSINSNVMGGTSTRWSLPPRRASQRAKKPPATE